jgi:hypothetical protein
MKSAGRDTSFGLVLIDDQLTADQGIAHAQCDDGLCLSISETV